MEAMSEIVIARPRAMVAAFMFDPSNDPLWASGVVACRVLGHGRLQAGAKVEQTSKIFGARSNVTYEIVSMDPERFLEMRLDDPFEMWVLQELEDVPGGTLVRIRTKTVGGDPGFFRLFGPLLGLLTRRNIRRDLRRLRRVIEAGPA
jgi:hypothetical protein